MTADNVGITKDNLPKGNFWEVDGSCWQYELDANSERGLCRLKSAALGDLGNDHNQKRP